MKNTIKLFGILLVVFGVFIALGSVSASHADLLQPAETVTYEEDVTVNGTLRTNSAYVGSTAAGVGGVTFFNGTIVNASVNEEGEDVLPVTFGDDVRIDGTIYRGETAGPGDNSPLKVNDDVRVYGDLTVEGGIAYNNSASGLSSTNMQDAIDEIGTQLTDAISGPAAASSPGVGELTASTWRGYVWLMPNATTFERRSDVWITFDPTSDTGGTIRASIDTVKNVCDHVSPCTPLPAGTVYTGTYKIVGNNILIKDYTPNPVGEPDPSYTVMRDVEIVGGSMSYVVEDGTGRYAFLERD